MKKVLLTIALPVCLVMGQDQPELPGWGVYGGVVMANASGDSLDGAEAVNLPGFGVSKGVMLGGLPMSGWCWYPWTRLSHGFRWNAC